MAAENVFEKIHVDESEKADLGGVLEQLNLPPQMVAFVRKHQRSIYIIISVIAVIVVAWALYDGHVKKQRLLSSSALYSASLLTGEERLTSLAQVEKDFNGLSAAQWATIELAHTAMNKKNYEEAAKKYSAIQSSLTTGDPLYPLVTFGLAQAEEQLESYEKSLSDYSLLKTIQGFESLAYLGSSRIEEKLGHPEKAVKELEEYLGTTIGDTIDSSEKRYINMKINRLQATL